MAKRQGNVVGRYIKNVTKSFGYAVIDASEELNPSIKAFSEKNADLGKSLYEAVKDYKGTFKTVKKSIKDSDIYEFASDYKKNLFEDLKSGTFYNRNREKLATERISGVDDDSLQREMDGMDFSDDEWDIDDDSDLDDTLTSSSIDSIGESISNSNAEVTIRSSEYIVNAQKDSTKLLMQNNNRLFNQALAGMAAINSNIGQLSGMMDIVSVHANNSSKYFEESNKLQQEANGYLKQIVQNTTVDVATNSNSGSSSRIKYGDVIDYDGTLDIKNLLGAIKQNVNDEVGDMFEMLKWGNDGGNVLQQISASPLKFLATGFTKKLLPQVTKDAMKGFNDSLKEFFPVMLNKLAGLEDTTEYGSSKADIYGIISKVFGLDNRLKEGIDVSKYNKGKVAWDGVARKSLVEIIPGQLSKIVSILSGEPPMVFDSERGKMADLRQSHAMESRRTQYHANYANSELIDSIKDYTSSKGTFANAQSKKDFEKDLEKFAMALYKKGGLTNYNDSDFFEKLGIDSFDNTTSEDIILHALKLNGQTRQGQKINMAAANRNRQERESQTKYMQNMENTSSSTVLNYLYGGYFDDSLKRTDAGNYKGIAGINGLFENSRDSLGNNIFFYLQGIYQFTESMSSNGVGGSGDFIGHRLPLRPIPENEDAKKNSLANQEIRQAANDQRNLDSRNASNEDRGIHKVALDDYNNEDEMFRELDTSYYFDQLRQDQDNEEKHNSIADMIRKSKAPDKLKSFATGALAFVEKPMEMIAKCFDSATGKFYKLIYGNASKEIQDMGFVGIIKENLEETFDALKTWGKDNILDPLKQKLGLDVKDKLLPGLKKKLLGEKDENGLYQNGKFSQYVNDTKQGFKDFGSKMKNNFLDDFNNFVGHHAYGGEVKKTGMAAVSEGEIIIPSDMNPNYHGSNNKMRQLINEKNSVQKFYGGGSKRNNGKQSIDRSGYYTDASGNGFDLNNLIGSVANQIGNRKGATAQKDKDNIISIIKKNIANGNGPKTAGEMRDYVASITADYVKNKLSTTIKDKASDINAKTNGKMAQAATGVADFGKATANELSNAAKSIKTELFDKTKAAMEEADKAAGRTPSHIEGIAAKTVFGEAKKNASAMTVGAGVGGILGTLIGGPIIGAAVGAGVGLATKSDTIQNWLFGKNVDDGKGGVEKSGGVFSKRLSNFMVDKLPNMARYGGAGLLAGTLLPGGPVVGAIVGSTLGYATKSQRFQEMIFGSEEDEDGNKKHKGIISKEKLQKLLPKAAAGAAVGLLAGPFGSPVANLILGSAAGFVSDSDRFKEALYGRVIGKDGKGEDIREGGLFENIREGVIIPFVNFAKDQTKDLKDWFEDKIKKPVEESMDPINKHLKMLAKSLGGFAKKFAKRQMKNVGAWLTNNSRMYRGIKNVGKNVITAGIGGAKQIAELPFSALGAVGNHLRAKDIAKGNADYMTAEERIQWRNDHNIKNTVIDKGKESLNTFGRAKSEFQKGHILTGLGNGIKGSFQGSVGLLNAGLKGTGGATYRALKDHQNGFDEFDNRIVDLNADQLEELRTAVGNFGDASKQNREDLNNTKRSMDVELSYTRINPAQQKKLLKLATSGKDTAEQEVRDAIDNMEIGEADKKKLLEKFIPIISKYSKTLHDNINQEDASKSSVKYLKDNFGINLSEANAEKMKDLLNTEIGSRNSDMLEARAKEAENPEERSANTLEDTKAVIENNHEQLIQTLHTLTDMIVTINHGKPIYGDSKALYDINGDNSDNTEEEETTAETNGTEEAEYEEVRAANEIPNSGNKFVNSPAAETVKNDSKDEVDENGFKDGQTRTETDESGNSINKIYDMEAHEWKIADEESQKIVDNNNKSKAAMTEMPGLLKNGLLGDKNGEETDKEKEDNASDIGILSSILGGLGIDPSITGLITKFLPGLKNFSLAGSLSGIAGMAGLIMFLRGDLDSLTNSIGNFANSIITKILPTSEYADTTDDYLQTSQSGENGEQGMGEHTRNAILKDIAKGGSKGGKKFFTKLSKKIKWDKTVDSVASIAGNRAAKKAGKKVVKTATKEALESGAKEAAEKTAKEAAIKSVQGAKLGNVYGKVTGLVNNGYEKILNDAAGKTAETAAEKTAKEAAESTLKSSLNEILTKIASKLPGGQKVLEALKKAFDKLASVGAEKSAKASAKETAEGLAKDAAGISPIGLAVKAAFAANDYTNGYMNASSIMGVENPTMGEKVISGILNALMGASFILSLIPTKEVVMIISEHLLPAMGFELKEFNEKRKTFADKVENYNKDNGTKYSEEQYNNVVKNKKSSWVKLLGENVTKTLSKKTRNKVNNGTDKDGNLVEGYLDENSIRWKEYWQKQIDKGKMKQDYAEACYMNECLHDSKLGLNDKRKADYKARIKAYEKKSGKKVPEIKRDLPGLISTGRSSDQSNFLQNYYSHFVGIRGLIAQDEVDYGTDEKSDSKKKKNGSGSGLLLSRRHRLGGATEESNTTQVTEKREPRQGSMVYAASNTVNSIGTATKGMLDKVISMYSDTGSGDISQIIEGINTKDIDKSDFKSIFNYVDNKIKGDGVFSQLNKALSRVSMALMMPAISLKRLISSTNDSYSESLGADGSSSKSRKTKSSGGIKGLFSKFVNIFTGGGSSTKNGSGSGLYGGSSFVSQLGASGNYGDSSYDEEGCAPASAAMMINQSLGGNVSLQDAGNYAVQKGYKAQGDGTKPGYFKDIFSNYGMDSDYTSNKGSIESNLMSGKPTVLLGKDQTNTSKSRSPFGGNPHYVVATGMDSRGNVSVNDPESNSPKVYDKSILNKVSMGVSTKLGGRAFNKLRRRYGGGAVGNDDNPKSSTVSMVSEADARDPQKVRHQNLGSFSPVSEEELNEWIASKAPSGSAFIGNAKVFLTASEQCGLDPRYIIAHAALESKWGSSDICVSKNNFFGIGAFDSSPMASAYSFGTGIDAGIIGGANWIAKNYYFGKYGQVSLYKMRWNNNVHQYATDPMWDTKIANIMATAPLNSSIKYDGEPMGAMAPGASTGTTSGSSDSSSSTSSSTSSSSSSSGSGDGSLFGGIFSKVMKSMYGDSIVGALGSLGFGFGSNDEDASDTTTTSTNPNAPVSGSATSVAGAQSASNSGSDLTTTQILENDPSLAVKSNVPGYFENKQHSILEVAANTRPTAPTAGVTSALMNGQTAAKNAKSSVPIDSTLLAATSPANNQLSIVNDSMANTIASTGAPSSVASKVVADAQSLVGVLPYAKGGESLVSGADCSGFVKALYSKNGVNIPRRRAIDMYNDTFGTTINDKSQLKPGDAVFFDGDHPGAPTSSNISHVGLYIGDNNMIHESMPGQKAKLSNIQDGYRGPRYVGAKRYAGGSGLLSPDRMLSDSQLFGGSSSLMEASVAAAAPVNTSGGSNVISGGLNLGSLLASSSSSDSVSSSDILKVLQTIADNTSSIAKIADLVSTLISGKSANSNNTVVNNASSESKTQGGGSGLSDNLSKMVSTLIQLATE